MVAVFLDYKKITTTATARKTAKKYIFTGCPKSSFLYFISLYFSTIGLGRQIKNYTLENNRGPDILDKLRKLYVNGTVTYN